MTFFADELEATANRILARERRLKPGTMEDDYSDEADADSVCREVDEVREIQGKEP